MSSPYRSKDHVDLTLLVAKMIRGGTLTDKDVAVLEGIARRLESWGYEDEAYFELAEADTEFEDASRVDRLVFRGGEEDEVDLEVKYNTAKGSIDVKANVVLMKGVGDYEPREILEENAPWIEELWLPFVFFCEPLPRGQLEIVSGEEAWGRICRFDVEKYFRKA